MRWLLLLCFLSPAASHADDLVDHKNVHSEWLRLHKTNSDQANAQLIFDPREHAMWIEQNGKIYRPQAAVAELPAGLKWYAFHVTNDGITELSFPVRVIQPKLSLPDDTEAEQIWLVGASEKQCIRLNVSANKGAHAFGTGIGSPIESAMVQLPALASRGEKQLKNNMLAPQSPRPPKYKEQIITPHFTFNVERIGNP